MAAKELLDRWWEAFAPWSVIEGGAAGGRCGWEPARTSPRLRRGALIAGLACLLTLAVASSGRAQVASVPDVLVTPGEVDARSFQSPQLAVDPTNQDRIVVAYHEAQRFESCYLARSQDGGQTWQNVRVVGAGTPYPMPPDYDECYDPQVAYGPGGTLYYEYQGYPGTNALGQRKTFITASREGRAFEPPKEIDPPQAGETDRTDLYSEMVVDQRSGRVYLSWGRFCEPSAPGPVEALACAPPGKVQVTSSSDGARSFSEPVTVSPPSSPDPARNSIAVDAAGTVYSAWIDGFLTAGRPGAPPPKLYAATSGDGGRSFGQPFQIAETEPCTGNLCYSPDAGGGGFIHAVGGPPGQAFLVGWDRRGTDKNRIFFSQTANSGQSWSAPRVVGIPAGGQDHEQHHPRMAVGPQGRIYIVYYDYSPEGFHEVYMIDSGDGGRSFSPPAKLSDVPSDARIGPYFHGAQEGEDLANFGQRLGIAATTQGPFAAWTDSRNGNAVNARLDIFVEGPSDAAGGPGSGVGDRGCLNFRAGVAGKRLGPARLGRSRRANRRQFRGARVRVAAGMERYCVAGGGSLRIGYPTRRLNRGLGRSARRRIRGRAVLVLTSSRRYRLRGIRAGSSARVMRRRLRGERRVRVGPNVWYVVRGRASQLVFKTRGGKVREIGLADKRLTASRRGATRLLRAYKRRP